MSSDEDSRQRRVDPRQQTVQRHPAHAGHLHIQNQAVRFRKPSREQERFRRIKSFRAAANAPHEGFHCLTNRLVVVNHGHERFAQLGHVISNAHSP